MLGMRRLGMRTSGIRRLGMRMLGTRMLGTRMSGTRWLAIRNIRNEKASNNVYHIPDANVDSEAGNVYCRWPPCRGSRQRLTCVD